MCRHVAVMQSLPHEAELPRAVESAGRRVGASLPCVKGTGLAGREPSVAARVLDGRGQLIRAGHLVRGTLGEVRAVEGGQEDTCVCVCVSVWARKALSAAEPMGNGRGPAARELAAARMPWPDKAIRGAIRNKGLPCAPARKLPWGGWRVGGTEFIGRGSGADAHCFARRASHSVRSV